MSDIEMRGITKRFSGVIANNGVDFDLCQGEVHALLGENGAGKSTLMNTLYGLYQPDSGTITISGKRQEFTSPHDAITAGIGMVHQHFMLIPSQTVWENMILGLDQLPQVLPKKKIIERIQAISEKYCLQVDPLSSIWQLSIGEQQRVAILQMLFRKTRFLILDEPTAVLTPQEAQHLFEVIRQMTGEGYGIVFISHKLEEVMSLSHRVTVLRKGKKVGTVETSQTSKEQLAEMMIGEKFVFSINKQKRQAGPVILEGDRLLVLSDRGLPVVREVTIQIRESEILGIAGISGNGQEELCEALAGLRKVESGDISMGKEDITGHSPRYFIAQGICYIPADRKGTGLIANLTVNENSILKQYWKKPIAQKTWIDWKAVATFALHLIQKFKVMAPSLITPVKNLSGGNQQKLMLGRELSGSPRVVIAVHPTWGLDVAATKFIREQLLVERDRGVGILLVSEDLEELLSLSDRLVVMCKGKIMGNIENPSEMSPETLGLMMAGTPLDCIQKVTA